MVLSSRAGGGDSRYDCQREMNRRNGEHYAHIMLEEYTVTLERMLLLRKEDGQYNNWLSRAKVIETRIRLVDRRLVDTEE